MHSNLSLSFSLEWMMKGAIPQLSSKMSNGPQNLYFASLFTASGRDKTEK